MFMKMFVSENVKMEISSRFFPQRIVSQMILRRGISIYMEIILKLFIFQFTPRKTSWNLPVNEHDNFVIDDKNSPEWYTPDLD